MRKQLVHLLAATLMAAGLLTAPGAALAAPSFLFDASGSNRLNAGPFTTLLHSVNLDITRFGSATISVGLSYLFPIIGGAVDAETIKFEAVSVGGLTITNGNEVLVLNSPIVNTTGTQPIMTFLVTINGNLQGRFPIFDLKVPDYPKPQVLRAGEKIHAASIVVTLSQSGAGVLNSAFGTSFTAGQAVGTVLVKSVLGEKLPG